MMAKRLAPTTTSPAKMGEEMAHPRVTASQSPNVKMRPRGNSKGGGEPATANHRTGVQGTDNRERNGAKWAPQMMMGSPEVLPSAQSTQRNVRVLPSGVGNRDFYLRRQYGQGM